MSENVKITNGAARLSLVVVAAIAGAPPVFGQAVNVTNGSTVEIPGPLFPSTSFTTSANDTAGYGFRSVNGSTIIATGADITTSGARAVGIYASSSAAPALIRMIGGSVTTTNPGGDGSFSAYGVYNGGSANGYFELVGTSISTVGNRAYGIFIVNSPHAWFDNVSVETSGATAYGVRAGGNAIVEIRADSRVETWGDGASGVLAVAGGRINIIDSIVITHGNIAGAIGASADATPNAARIAAERLQLETYGQRSSGVTAFQNGSSVTLSDSSIHVRGAGSFGLFAQNTGTIDATGLTILLDTGVTPITGNQPAGLHAFGGNEDRARTYVNIRDATVTTLGDQAFGAYAVGRSGDTAVYDGWGIIDASNVRIETRGANAHGLVVAGGGMMIFTDGTVVAASPTAAGMAGLMSVDRTNIFVIERSRIDAGGDGFLAAGGANDVTFNASTLNAGSGIAMNFVSNHTNFVANAAEINGAARTDALATSYLTLQGGTLWNMSGDSVVTNLTNDSSLIAFAPPTGDVASPASYRTLTAHTYVGRGGTIGLNTHLAGDGAATDRLILRGGAASGDTRLLVANAGGQGEGTSGDGIRLVETANGATTTPDAFRLGARVAAGAYEYMLFRGGSASTEDWFLRSFLVETPEEPDPPLPPVPLYRPEVPLYAPLPDLGRQMGRATLATLHDRVGEEENIRGLAAEQGRGSTVNGAWVRVFGERTENRWRGSSTSQANGTLGGIQAGVDLLRHQGASGHRDHAGIYAAYADYSATRVRGFAMGIEGLTVGRIQMEGPALGAYWTHFGPGGWYVDAVVQAHWFDAKAVSNYQAGMNTNGHGLTASLEGGYPIALGGGWQVEPQAQVIWQSVSVDDASDAYSTVSWREGNATTARLGARLQYTGQGEDSVWQPYLRANLWHAFSGTDRSTFGASAPVETRYGDTALEAGIGVTARFGRHTSAYAHLGRVQSLDGSRGRMDATHGGVGLRINW